MRISSRNNKNSNIMNRATSSSSTVLGVGCLFLLLILAPSAPSSSKFGFVEAVEFIADNAVDIADTEQIISIQYSTRTMMEDVDGGDSDFNSTTSSNDNDGIDDSNETETEPKEYNDHGIDGHNVSFCNREVLISKYVSLRTSLTFV